VVPNRYIAKKNALITSNVRIIGFSSIMLISAPSNPKTSSMANPYKTALVISSTGRRAEFQNGIALTRFMIKPLYIPHKKANIPAKTLNEMSRTEPGNRKEKINWRKPKPENNMVKMIPRVNHEVFHLSVKGGTVRQNLNGFPK